MPRRIATKNHVSFELGNILSTLVTYMIVKSNVEIEKLKATGKRVCFNNFPQSLHNEWVTNWSNIITTAEDQKSRTRTQAREIALDIVREKYAQLNYNWPIEPAILFSQIEEAGENGL